MMTLQERVHGSPPPASWQLSKLRRVFRVRKGFKNVGMQEDNLLSLSYGRIVPKDIDTTGGLLPESFETYQIVEPGNIVVRLTDLQNDKRSLRQGLVRQRGIVTSAYDALEVGRGHDPRFLAYALLALDLAKYYYSLGGGVRQSISFTDFPNEWFAIPSLEVQKVIADFLDHETSCIDQLIAKKLMLTRLLREKKSTRVAFLLSKGMRSGVKMKDSGLDWLGQVPEHWVLKKLRYLSTIETGDRDTEERIDDGKYPFFVRSDQIERINSYRLDCEAVLTSGDGAGVAKVFHYYTGKFDFHQRVYAFTNFRDIRGRYFYYFFSTFFPWQMSLHSAKSTVDSVRMPFLKGMVFVIPPIAEQDEIIRVLDSGFRKLDGAVRMIERSIDTLHERRTALITAAVTGQIDVRDWEKRGEANRRLQTLEILPPAAQAKREARV